MKMTLEDGIRLLTLAKEALDAAPEEEDSQAIVLLTHAGNFHCYYTTLQDLPATEDRIVAELQAQAEAAVCALLVVWKKGGVDLPSYSLREKLIALEATNREALLFMPVVRLLESTMLQK